jgi:hypothetical protein
MNTKIVLAITALIVVAASLAAVTAIQFVGAQNATAPTQTPTGTVPPYVYGNGTISGYGCYGYGYGAQGQTQYGAGMMGRGW